MKTKSKAKRKKAKAALPDVLTLAEAAAWLRVEESALLPDVQAGRVPARQVGGEWRFHKGALSSWLKRPAVNGRPKFDGPDVIETPEEQRAFMAKLRAIREEWNAVEMPGEESAA